MTTESLASEGLNHSLVSPLVEPHPPFTEVESPYAALASPFAD